MAFNKQYVGENLNHVAFPLGGIGAGMVCVEGTGCLSGFSLRNNPDVNFEPCLFSAVTVKGANGESNISRVLEGPVPKRKIFGGPACKLNERLNVNETKARGMQGACYGLPRFREVSFEPRFPFANVKLSDTALPIDVTLEAWSPFTPPNADDSSYPFAYLEYNFTNRSDEPLELVYYFASMNFFPIDRDFSRVYRYKQGFVFTQDDIEEKPWHSGAFHAYIDDNTSKVNTALYRGIWFDTLTMLWNDIEKGLCEDKELPFGAGGESPGACLSLQFSLAAGATKRVRLGLCWYVPKTRLRLGFEEKEGMELSEDDYYRPWYSAKFKSIEETADAMRENTNRLREQSAAFRDTLFASSLPELVMDALSSNLSILKSPTILRQTDGRLWGWEGCRDKEGSCHGSCTHVWNYAFALCYLFPTLERSLRQTEFFETQNEEGHQDFRASLPIRPSGHDNHAAADGQLGGLVKLYRDYTLCGDIKWLRELWKKAKVSLEYCIRTWDKKEQGVLTEPHHNTYDIEFWGPNGMCSSFYLAALRAAEEICAVLGEDGGRYRRIYESGKIYIENELFNGEYFIQKVMWHELDAKLPLHNRLSAEARKLIEETGPTYQYASGCLSDGVIGCWMAKMCGLGDILNPDMVKSHLLSVYKYNFRRDLSAHANPQRPGYCLGDEAGLLLCSWPHGKKPALPFVYSDEVWTGIEYQVASHLISIGCKKEGMDIIQACRSRYDGSVRNPFDEYECGHWYARALASYSLIQAFTGVRYNAADKTLYLSKGINGDYQVLLAAHSGYGLVGIRGGKPFAEAVFGKLEVERFVFCF